MLAKLSPPRKLTVSAIFRMGDAGRGGFAVRALLHHSPGPALRAPATPQAEWVTRNCRKRRLGTKWESPALVRALRGSILLTCARLHVRKREDDLAARIWMHGWGSRGRGFKSRRPDAGQKADPSSGSAFWHPEDQDRRLRSVRTHFDRWSIRQTGRQLLGQLRQVDRTGAGKAPGLGVAPHCRRDP